MKKGLLVLVSLISLMHQGIAQVITNNNISADQYITYCITPDLLNGSIPTGGTGSYSYVWLESTVNATIGFVAASGVNNAQNYQPPATSTTWYKRVVNSGAYTDTSNAVAITFVDSIFITPSGPIYLPPNSVVLLCATPFISNANYVWEFQPCGYLNWTPIPGATMGCATILSGPNGACGNIMCEVAANCPTQPWVNIVSVSFYTSVNAPIISPVGTTYVCSGDTVTLSTPVVSGSTYQWLLNYSPITGATNASYTTSSAGNYNVQVSNGSSFVLSDTTTLINQTLPTAAITANGATTFCQGGSVSLNNTTQASNTNYQWSLNGAAINGATNNSYTATTSGNYTLNASINGCASISDSITVTVNPLPNITLIQPSTDIWCEGDTVSILASAGSGATAYQWQKNNVIIPGATNNYYKAYTTGYYTAVVTALGCEATSSAMFDSFVTAPPVAITQSGNTLFATSGFYYYHWYLNGLPIVGATNQSYTPTQNGNYYVKASTLSSCTGLSNTISFLLGIDELSNNQLLTISPNPFNESFTVNCPSGKGTITVTDAVGKVVASYQLPVARGSQPTTDNSPLKIDMKGFSSGVYLVKYQNESQTETVKIIKE